MSNLVQVGNFCPYKECDSYGKLAEEGGQVIKSGKTNQKRQRYKCKKCGRMFCERAGTIFYGKRKEENEIIGVLAMIAEGSRISSIHRITGYKEDTILGWLREAAMHAEAVEAILLADYQVNRGQLDSLWSYVGNKGEKKGMLKVTPRDSFGEPR